MSDTLRRTVRTFLQAFVPLAAAALLGALNTLLEWAQDGGGPLPDLTSTAWLLVAAALSGGIAVVTWAHNWLEDSGHIRSRK